MARLMKDCFCCTLKTACVYIAAYTMVVALLLLAFNINDFVVIGNGYILWGSATSLVFAVLLIIASICLLRGTVRDRGDLMAVWLVIFLVYTIFSLVTVAQNIHYWRHGWVPVRIHDSIAANTVIFGLLMFFDIMCLLAVFSQRQHLLGFSGLP